MNGERESMGGRQNMPIDIDSNPKVWYALRRLFLVLPAIPNREDAALAHRE